MFCEIFCDPLCDCDAQALIEKLQFGTGGQRLVLDGPPPTAAPSAMPLTSKAPQVSVTFAPAPLASLPPVSAPRKTAIEAVVPVKVKVALVTTALENSTSRMGEAAAGNTEIRGRPVASRQGSPLASAFPSPSTHQTHQTGSRTLTLMPTTTTPVPAVVLPVASFLSTEAPTPFVAEEVSDSDEDTR
jgi:hypothetical protein